MVEMRLPRRSCWLTCYFLCAQGNNHSAICKIMIFAHKHYERDHDMVSDSLNEGLKTLPLISKVDTIVQMLPKSKA